MMIQIYVHKIKKNFSWSEAEAHLKVKAGPLKTLLTCEGKPTGASQQELHYDLLCGLISLLSPIIRHYFLTGMPPLVLIGSTWGQ
jgi:hypothetical protein